MRAILDTSVVIAADVPPLEGELAVSAVTLAELHFGVLVAKDQNVRAERLRRLLLLQRTFDAVPVDGAVAASYGQLTAAIVEPPHMRIRRDSTPATSQTSSAWRTWSRLSRPDCPA